MDFTVAWLEHLMLLLQKERRELEEKTYFIFIFDHSRDTRRMW